MGRHPIEQRDGVGRRAGAAADFRRRDDRKVLAVKGGLPGFPPTIIHQFVRQQLMFRHPHLPVTVLQATGADLVLGEHSNSSAAAS